MDDTQFLKGFDHYYDNYCLGLKKQANQALRQFMCDFDKLCPTLKTQLLEQLCFQLYEQQAPTVKKLLNRGNGSLPYELGWHVQQYPQTSQTEDLASYYLAQGVVIAPPVCIYYQK